MSYCKLDENGKTIPSGKRSNRKPAKREERGGELYHYEIYVAIPLPSGEYKQVRRRKWLPDDEAAADYERELRGAPPRKALTWVAGHQKWLDANKNDLSQGHVQTSRAAIDLWCEKFGKHSTIEGTTLLAFSEWIGNEATKGTGRAAQIKHEHFLAIARWCRARGLVESIPFDKSPKPKARTKTRRPASIQEFLDYREILPESMRHLWSMLGWTGMRLTAACELREDKIESAHFSVLTKFRKWIPYPRTPEVDRVIAAARRFKAKREIDSPYLFTKDNGNPWKKDYFNNRLHLVAKEENERRREHNEAQLPIITSHQLRHMAGTVGGENNLSPDQLQALLAQDSRQSSENYVDKTMGMRRFGMATLAKAISDVEKMYKNDTEIDKDPYAHLRDGPYRDLLAHTVTCPSCGCKFHPDKA